MLSLLLLAAVQSADTVRYAVTFPNAVHHEAEITLTVPAAGRDTVEVWMSRSSPGRYAMHEFAKNVYGVEATDGAGHPLEIVRRDPYRWLVVARGGPVAFRYTLFADRAGGTYSQVDRTHAHLNMPATFAFARGYEARPIAIRFTPPEGSGWRAATQLVPGAGPMTFAAPDLQYFMDSPTELSDHALRTWTVAGPAGRVDTIRLAVHHLGTEAEVDAYAAMARKVVAEQVGLFGETARYDNGTYTFIADYLPWASGDGMEHRNSTILSSSGSLARSASGLLGTLSHEFFHSWNMERIRSRMIEPFDFTTTDPSDGLWFGEGFTSYFDDLFIRRAGLMDDAAYIGGLGGLVNAVVNAPARRYGSPMEMSIRAPFVDAATAIDPTNFSNIFLSYYTWGAGIGLGLDLTLRGRFPGKSLDGFMRLMWERFGAGNRYAVKQPYTVDDIERTLGAYTGDPAFARDFFARHIRGREVVDYAALLAQAGVVLRQARPDRAWSGLRLGRDDATLSAGTTVGTPAYDAGLERGDVVRSLDGRTVQGAADVLAVEAAHRPGDVVTVVFEQRGTERTARLTLVADPRLEAVALEATGGTLTPAQAAFRADWLRSRAR
ncbi:MAG TPA: PDZ domain-containing protein [Gemmatimonadales bacterium]|nr:PDZ domain-containing protein [Gemmatimonadales bacterium]